MLVNVMMWMYDIRIVNSTKRSCPVMVGACSKMMYHFSWVRKCNRVLTYHDCKRRRQGLHLGCWKWCSDGWLVAMVCWALIDFRVEDDMIMLRNLRRCLIDFGQIILVGVFNHLTKTSQIGSCEKIGMNIRHIWNHHPVYLPNPELMAFLLGDSATVL